MDAAGRILIIDDDAGPRESLRMIIKDRYPVVTAESAVEALKLLTRYEFSVILLDLRMPQMDGITALREIKRLYPDVEVLIVTAYASVETAREAIQYGAFDYLMKPFDKDDVIQVVEKGIDKRRKARKFVKEHSELKDLCDERSKELAVAEKMRSELFNNANEGIVIMNATGAILDLNPKACEIWGCGKEELLGENIVSREAEKSRGLWKERLLRLLQGEALLFEAEYPAMRGKNIFLEVSARAIEIDGTQIIQSFYRDITEKKRFQDQLFLAEKMKSMGTLAGGLAHDLGNILTAILGHTGLILLSQGEGLSKETLKNLEIIESSAQYASNVVAQLLSFSRRGESEFSPLVVNEVIEGTLMMISKILKPTITIDKQLGLSVQPIMGHVTQLGQVFMNLIINAGDAMPDGGTILIETDMVQRNPGSHTTGGAFQERTKAEQFVCLRISDTGTGISEEHLQHIFEPFYTTKQKGTGLGLAAVYGIVKDHGGEIKVKSTVGCGTVFTIYFPVVKQLYN